MDALQFVSAMVFVAALWATCSRSLPTGILGTLGLGLVMLACLSVLDNSERNFRNAVALLFAGDALILAWILGCLHHARQKLRSVSPHTDFGALYGTPTRTPSTRC